MSDRTRLAISVTDSRSGRAVRLSYDDLSAANLPQDIQYSSTAPGGHKDLSFTLLRDLFPRAGEDPFNRVQVYGPGGKVLWGGRIATLPRQTGQNYSLSPTCVGMQAHLEDDSSFMEVYADRDPGSWEDPPLARRAALGAAGFNISGTNGIDAATGEALTWEVARSVPAEAVAELWYRAPGSIRVKSVEFNGTRTGTWTGFESPAIIGYDTPTTGQVSTTDASFGLSMHELIMPTAKRYASFRVYNASAGTLTPPANTRQTLSKMTVYGNHGLSRHFPTDGGGLEPSGLYGSDVVANVLSRAAPLLKFTTGNGGTITPTGTLVIPHLVFKEPTTAAAVIQAVNGFYGWDWLVWDDVFYYQPAASGTVWRARRADGAALAAEGPSTDDLWNGARVTFTDVDGVQKIAGPADSGFEVESVTLGDADAANPVNLAGIPRRWLPVDVTNVGMMSSGLAVALGQVRLAEANAYKRRGQVTVQGTVQDPTGRRVPVSEVRAGDTIVFGDLFDYIPQRIDEASYSHQSRSATLGINGPLNRSESILERLALFTGLSN